MRSHQVLLVLILAISASAGVAHLVELSAAVGSPATLAGTPTSAGDGAEPDLAGSVGAVPAQTLLDLLLSAPFPVDGLPQGVDQPVIQIWDEGDETLSGAVGGVQVWDPDQLFPTVSYLIYPLSESAIAANRAFLDEASASDVTPSEASGFDVPAVVLDYGGLVVCQALVGNVIVFGLAGGEQEADLAVTATAAAIVGVRHLERLAADHAAGITPVYATGVLADVAPRDFLARLLAAPFPGSDLPPGFANPKLVAWEDEADADLIGTIGAAQVEFEDGAVGITYLIFPNEGAAGLRLTQAATEAKSVSIVAIEIAGMTYPARLLTFEDGTLCLVQVGYVVVFGRGAEDRDGAIELATAGVAQIVALASGESLSTPIS